MKVKNICLKKINMTRIVENNSNVNKIKIMLSTNAIMEKYSISNTILGSGVHGFVLLGIEKKTDKKVAIKFSDSSIEMLRDEVIIMREIGQKAEYFKGKNYGVAVVPYKGESLQSYIKKGGCFPEWFTIKKLFMDILEDLISIHRYYVYRDISLGNICINNGYFSLIDFGLCKDFKMELERLYNNSKTSCVVGTLIFTSISVNKKNPCCFRDDIESLCYLVWYIFGGGLPWVGLKGENKKKTIQLVLNSKQKSICPLPEINNVLQYLKTLTFKDGIDYDIIKQKIQTVEIEEIKEETKTEKDFTYNELKKLLKENEVDGRSKLTTKKEMFQKLFELRCL